MLQEKARGGRVALLRIDWSKYHVVVRTDIKKNHQTFVCFYSVVLQ